MFQKARKTQSKLRLAIDGPSGAGKTYTALIAATAMANGGKIAVIDTERNSASLYADKFDFDVACLDNFNPKNYIKTINEAEQAGYSVIVIDSLSHAWEGEGGVLDMHEDATRRSQSGNSYTAWKDVTPVHRELVDAILQSKTHIVVTMRSKMEYVQSKEGDKTVIKKVGMAPIQRAGIEYEFTIVGDMDTDHNFIVSKSRCEFIADAVVKKPDAAFFKKILDWLNSGDAQPDTLPVAKPVQPVPSNNGHKDAAPITLEEACNVLNREGVKYGDLPTDKLNFMLNAVSKKSNLDNDQLLKVEAMKMILKARKSGEIPEPAGLVETAQELGGQTA